MQKDDNDGTLDAVREYLQKFRRNPRVKKDRVVPTTSTAPTGEDFIGRFLNLGEPAANDRFNTDGLSMEQQATSDKPTRRTYPIDRVPYRSDAAAPAPRPSKRSDAPRKPVRPQMDIPPASGGPTLPPYIPFRERRGRKPFPWLLLVVIVFLIVLVIGILSYLWNKKQAEDRMLFAPVAEQVLESRTIPTQVQSVMLPSVVSKQPEQAPMTIFIPHIASGHSQTPVVQAPDPEPAPQVIEAKQFDHDCPEATCMVIKGRMTINPRDHGVVFWNFDAPSGTAYALRVAGHLGICATTLAFGEVANNQKIGSFVINKEPTDCNRWMDQFVPEVDILTENGNPIHLHYKPKE